MNVLFLCVANSARSQMAEALAKAAWGPKIVVKSAGSKPCGWIHPWAMEAMREIGIDIRNQKSKGISDLPEEFLRRLDYVITPCADEACPAFANDAQCLNWPFNDPAADPEESKRDTFRRTRHALDVKIRRFGEDQGWDHKIITI
jgi:arsenate reductase